MSGVPPSSPGPTRLVWTIALPAMLANLATALFGLADMWVIGRLGDAPAQGAVELGAKFMMGLLIVFNFLRTGTIALTAQAAGRDDAREQAAGLTRALAASLAIGAALLLIQPLAISAGLEMLEATGRVADEARTYVGIRYWGSVPWLINCVLTGWLIGRRRVRTVLYVEVTANVVHILLDLAFVLLVGWGVAGVAVATVSSEVFKMTLLGMLVAREPAARMVGQNLLDRAIWDSAALKQLFALNRDLFLRTLMLTGAMMIFARSGAQQGAVILAANGILFQLFMLATLILDGFENATQVLCGEAKGSGDRARFRAIVRTTLASGMFTGIALSAAYFAFGDKLAATFSTDPAVIGATGSYVFWVALLPVLGVFSFVLDGVFVGAGWTRAMVLTMLGAMAVYCGLLLLASPLTNHGLWLAFSLFFVARAGAQLAVMPRLIRRDFPAGAK